MDNYKSYIFTDETVFSLTGQGDIVIPAGEEHKTLETCMQVWQQMEALGMTRDDVLICQGGGVVTDLGGFCAACYKRGIRHINRPTTLLSTIDAAYGGKTGVNFLGLKNNIGAFHLPIAVEPQTQLFHHLDSVQLRSGMAEMVKHGLLDSSEMFHQLLAIDLNAPDVWEQIIALLPANLAVKERIVEQDPEEKGLRKALNFGHTIGHAIEELSGMPHGYAVLYGMVAELYLSVIRCDFPREELRLLTHWKHEYFGSYQCPCSRVDELLDLMRHDKKNEGESINFTLLSSIGTPLINQYPTDQEIREALDFLS